MRTSPPPGSIYNPLTELHWPAFLKGDFQPKLGTALGLPAHVSAALYLAVPAVGIGWLWRVAKDSKERPGGMRGEKELRQRNQDARIWRARSVEGWVEG